MLSKESPLFSLSPAWMVAENAIVGLDLSWTMGMSLGGADPECMSDQDIEQLSAQLSNLLALLPEGILARFYSLSITPHREYITHYVKQFAGSQIMHPLAQEKADQIHKRLSPRAHELYLFLSDLPDTPKGFLGRLALHRLFAPKNWSARVQQKGEDARRKLERAISTIEQGCRSAGLSPNVLKADEIYGVVWRMANPSSNLAPPQYNEMRTLREQLHATNLVQTVDHYRSGNQLYRVATFRLPPRVVQASLAQELQKLPFPSQVVVSVRRVENREAQKRLTKLAVNAEQIMLAKQGPLAVRERQDLHLATQANETVLAKQALMSGDKMVECAVQVSFSAENQRLLNERTDQVAHQMRLCGGAEIGLEEARMVQASLSMLPGNHGIIGKRYFTLMASAAADLLPVYRSWEGAKAPLALFSTHGQEIVGVNPFDERLTSWNACISGGTGRGKSVLVRYQLSPWVARGGRVTLVTRGQDYDRFGALWGARVYVPGKDEGISLSPFLSARDFATSQYPQDELDQLAAVLAIMVVGPTELCDFKLKSFLRNACGALYQSCRQNLELTPDFETFMQTADRLEDPRMAKLIKQRLTYWLQGTLGASLRAPPEQVEAKFSIWNLENIEDTHAQTLVLALISSAVRKSLTQGRTQFILDEVWALFKHPAGEAIVENAYRTIRKQKGSITIVSQGVTDYAGLPQTLRNAVLNNAEIQMILPHAPAEWEAAAKLFSLNEREKTLLQSIASSPGQFSEFLAFYGDRHKRLRLVLTPFEYWLTTSHPDDLLQEQRRQQMFPKETVGQRIAALAAQWPRGAIGQVHRGTL